MCCAKYFNQKKNNLQAYTSTGGQLPLVTARWLEYLNARVSKVYHSNSSVGQHTNTRRPIKLSW